MEFARTKKGFLLAAAAGLSLIQVSAFLGQAEQAPAKSPVWTADLAAIRKVAGMIPGQRPVRINVVKFAESRRSRKFSLKGAPDEPSVQARTAYQVVYPQGTIMVDSGMDEQVHKFFGRGAVEPYDAAAAAQVEKAVRAARAILVTHEHGDHVAGVIRTPYVDEIAPKTVLTRTQVQTLLTNPQMPEIKLTPEMASRYIVIDYDKYYPFAPGMALIKAPGHTPGSQMVYVVLQSGKEYLLTGDCGWLMDNVRLMRGKDAPWVTEDEGLVMAELQWLNGIDRTEKNVTIVVSHDDEQRKQYIAAHMLGDHFE
jgi:glyoxylase-like metal-dependent hydrolase (beta-lactamase superfamily II)